MGGFAQICRGFCKLGGDTDTGLKAPNGVNFNSARRNFDTPLLLVSNSNGVNFNTFVSLLRNSGIKFQTPTE